MKKFLLIFLVGIFAVALLSACSTTENCPAYSDAQPVSAEVENVA